MPHPVLPESTRRTQRRAAAGVLVATVVALALPGGGEQSRNTTDLIAQSPGAAQPASPVLDGAGPDLPDLPQSPMTANDWLEEFFPAITGGSDGEEVAVTVTPPDAGWGPTVVAAQADRPTEVAVSDARPGPAGSDDQDGPPPQPPPRPAVPPTPTMTLRHPRPPLLWTPPPPDRSAGRSSQPPAPPPNPPPLPHHLPRLPHPPTSRLRMVGSPR